MTDAPPAGEPPRAHRHRAGRWSGWRWPLVVVVLGAMTVGAFLATLDRFLDAGERIAGAPADLVGKIGRAARGFLTGDVTRRFLSSIPSQEAVGAGRLEVAVATTVETVTRSDEQRAFWDLVPLGRTEVEIRVPVTWRWHLPLDDGWSATIDDGILRIVAPVPRPSLPPAIHTDGMERRTQSDWLRFDAPARLADLERELTSLLAARAGDPQHRELAREPARRTIERFARLWYLQQAPDGGDLRAIVVRFADEPESGSAAGDSG
ncbi:MAG: hypothetical protein AB7G12_13875 [Thermoanaerobaculia bacterium]